MGKDVDDVEAPAACHDPLLQFRGLGLCGTRKAAFERLIISRHPRRVKDPSSRYAL